MDGLSQVGIAWGSVFAINELPEARLWCIYLGYMSELYIPELVMDGYMICTFIAVPPLP